MLHFLSNYLFYRGKPDTKNASEPLQGLGFLPMTFTHKMLHWCNILKELTHKKLDSKTQTS